MAQGRWVLSPRPGRRKTAGLGSSFTSSLCSNQLYRKFKTYLRVCVVTGYIGSSEAGFGLVCRPVISEIGFRGSGVASRSSWQATLALGVRIRSSGTFSRPLPDVFQKNFKGHCSGRQLAGGSLAPSPVFAPLVERVGGLFSPERFSRNFRGYLIRKVNWARPQVAPARLPPKSAKSAPKTPSPPKKNLLCSWVGVGQSQR